MAFLRLDMLEKRPATAPQAEMLDLVDTRESEDEFQALEGRSEVSAKDCRWAEIHVDGDTGVLSSCVVEMLAIASARSRDWL